MGNAIKTLHDIDTCLHGDEWLAEVSEKQDDGTSHWKPLDDWVAEFEVKPEEEHESERKNKIKAAVRSKAKEVLLEKIDQGMVRRILRLILDVSSKILTQAESSLPALSPTGRILNDVNGIILSYRFEHAEKHKEYKFDFYRRKASDHLTASLWEFLPEKQQAAALQQMQEHVQQTLLYLQSEVRPVLMESLDTIFIQVNKRVNQRVAQVEEKLGNAHVSLAFEERLMQLDMAVNQVTAVADEVAAVADEVVVVVGGTESDSTGIGSTLNVMGIDAEQTKQELQDTVAQTANATEKLALESKEALILEKDATVIAVHDKTVKVEKDLIAAKDAALQKKTQVLANFAELVKSLLISKMDQLTVRMVEIMDRLFLAFYEIQVAARVGETKSTNTLEQVQTKMYDRVQLLAVHLKEHVQTEVLLVTETIGAMVDHSHEDEEEQVDELEEEGGNKE